MLIEFWEGIWIGCLSPAIDGSIPLTNHDWLDHRQANGII
jgi:hypothetical protein